MKKRVCNKEFRGQIKDTLKSEPVRFGGIWAENITTAIYRLRNKNTKGFYIVDIERNGFSYPELAGVYIKPKTAPVKPKEEPIFPGFEEAYNKEKPES